MPGRRKAGWKKIQVDQEIDNVADKHDKEQLAKTTDESLYFMDKVGKGDSKNRKRKMQELMKAQESSSSSNTSHKSQKKKSGAEAKGKKYVPKKKKDKDSFVTSFTSPDIWGSAKSLEQVAREKVIKETDGFYDPRARNGKKERSAYDRKANQIHVKKNYVPDYGLSINPTFEEHEEQIARALEADEKERKRKEDIELKLKAKHPSQQLKELPEVEETVLEPAIKKRREFKTQPERNRERVHKLRQQDIEKAKAEKKRQNELNQIKSIAKKLNKEESEKEEKLAAHKKYLEENPKEPRIGGYKKEERVPDFVLTEDLEAMEGKLRNVIPSSNVVSEQFMSYVDKNMMTQKRHTKKVNKTKYKQVYTNSWREKIVLKNGSTF